MLSIAFSLTWTAITDPDQYFHELSLWVLVVKITEAFKADIRKSSNEMKGQVSPRVSSNVSLSQLHEELLKERTSKNQNALFEEVLRILVESGTNATTSEKPAEEDY